MFDGVLTETEEIWARDRIRMLSVADMVRLLHDVGPRARRGAGDNRTVRNVRGNYLEFGPVPAIEDRAVVDYL